MTKYIIAAPQLNLVRNDKKVLIRSISFNRAGQVLVKVTEKPNEALFYSNRDTAVDRAMEASDAVGRCEVGPLEDWDAQQAAFTSLRRVVSII